MTGRRALKARAGIALALTLPVVLGACGGTRQDASEPSGTFPVSVVKASFPSSQALAGRTTMTIAVRNDGSRTVPDVAVTVNSFTKSIRPPASVCASASPPTSCTLADANRPVWVVNQGPLGGQTAYTNTWALGSLQPGATRTFTWDVTAVVPGQHTISYQVAAGLNGKARAQDSQGGGIPQGSFNVSISHKAPQSRVDPNTGRVIRSPPALGGRGRGGAGGSSSGGSSSGGSGGSGGSSGSGNGSQPSSGAGSGSY